MFCEKCGKELTGLEKFCPGCGEAIQQENESVVESTPKVSAYSVQAPVSTPTKPKKPMSKKTKMGIIIGAVVAVALVVALTIVVPMITSINVKNYIDYSLRSGNVLDGVYNGHIDLHLSIDEDKIEEEYEIDEYDTFFDSVDIYDAIDYCDLNATVKGRNDESISNLTKDDVIIVTIDWTDDKEELAELKHIEKVLGVKFSKRDSVFEIKVSDIISQEGYIVVEPLEFSFFDAAKDLFVTKGYSAGTIEFDIASSFNAKVGEYTLEYNKDSKCMTFKDASGETVDVISVNGLQGDLSNGDVVEVSFDSENVENTSIFFTETSKEFTIKATEPLTAKQAKSNIKLIENAVVELDTENNEEYGVYKSTLIKAFIFNVKATAEDEETYKEKLVTITKDKISGEGTAYVVKVFNDPSLKDGKIEYTEAYYLDDWWWGWSHDTLKDATEYLNDTDNIDNYTRTKIFG